MKTKSIRSLRHLLPEKIHAIPSLATPAITAFLSRRLFAQKKVTIFLALANSARAIHLLYYFFYKKTAIPIKVKKLVHFKSEELPKYETDLSSGFDVRAQLEKTITIKPKERRKIPTGLQFEIPPGFELQARPRSGWALRTGITLLNSPGTIDADYRGEVEMIVINHGEKAVKIQPQDRIAQLILAPTLRAQIETTTSLSKTIRGNGGFGSTGKRTRNKQ